MLNRDLYLHIFSFFNLKDKTKMRIICKEWKMIIDEQNARLIQNYPGPYSTSTKLKEIYHLTKQPKEVLSNLVKTSIYAKLFLETPELSQKFDERDKKMLSEKANKVPVIEVRKRNIPNKSQKFCKIM